uniref:Pheromone n=1 Tax=Peronospora matthiolae TaxID=2874970 RepID=A0AAV1SZQ7_9STRA
MTVESFAEHPPLGHSDVPDMCHAVASGISESVNKKEASNTDCAKNK